MCNYRHFSTAFNPYHVCRLKWLEFLEGSKDAYWASVETGTQYAPIRKSGDILPDPPNALTVELAEKVASGHVLPHEARQQSTKNNDAVPSQKS